jgi:uncharacterized protein YdaU (DUF1376 family)
MHLYKMPAQSPAEAHRKFALLCLERLQDVTDPAVRAWWVSVAQAWHDKAMKEEKGPAERAEEDFTS